MRKTRASVVARVPRVDRVSMLRTLLVLGMAFTSGCVIVQPRVTNPLPNVTRVAVVPFANHSIEPAVDTVLVTNAYYGELQQIPGFEVVPISITAKAIEAYDLRMQGPRDALELARVLDVDAVVVGAVTDYDPYDPPRIGWHVEWYSPNPPDFARGVPVDPRLRPDLPTFGRGDDECCEEGDRDGACVTGRADERGSARDRRWPTSSRVPARRPVVRGQSDVAEEVGRSVMQTAETPADAATESGYAQVLDTDLEQLREELTRPKNADSSGTTVEFGERASFHDLKSPPPPSRPDDTLRIPTLDTLPVSNVEDVESLPPPAIGPGPDSVDREATPGGATLEGPVPSFGEVPYPSVQPFAVPATPPPFDPHEPIMSYTRMFDGRDQDLLARLRDYYELNGDDRAGGWRGYLQRSEDFIRFTAHVSIVEMLTLHGGETRRRYVWKWRARS